MEQFKNPICKAPDPDSWRGVCGVEMKQVAERHPLWQKKAWVFLCPKCEAMQAITEDRLGSTVVKR